MSDAFDPTSLIDDETGTWSFDRFPVPEVLATLADRGLTGLLRLRQGDRSHRLYLREGQPVGVDLAEVVAPLGQVLLELGDLNAASYVQAQRLIDEEGRLPGQVYVELGLIDSARLKVVLQIQAARKAQRFVESCRGPFEFSRGLSFLTGFVAAPLDMDRLIAQALQAWLDPAQAQRVLASLGTAQLRAPEAGLIRVDTLGWGLAESRFLARLADWQTVDDLDRFGTLPRAQMALLLRFLQLRRRLQLRPMLDPLPGATPERRVVVPQPVADDEAAAATGGASAGKKTSRKREKTERISIELPGWREPRDARVERTEQLALPSVLVDYSALGVRGTAAAGGTRDEITAVTTVVDEPEDDEDDDASKNTSPTIRIKK